jgi:hypothetical protein
MRIDVTASALQKEANHARIPTPFNKRCHRSGEIGGIPCDVIEHDGMRRMVSQDGQGLAA